MRNSVGVGTLGELAVQKELHRQGYNVYVPLCDNDGVDLIVEDQNHNKFTKVNVKTISKLTTRSSIEIKMNKHIDTGRVDDKKDRFNIALKQAKNNQSKNRLWFYAYTEFPEYE